MSEMFDQNKLLTMLRQMAETIEKLKDESERDVLLSAMSEILDEANKELPEPDQKTVH